MKVKCEQAPKDEGIHHITVSYLKPKPGYIPIFVPRMLTRAITRYGGLKVFLNRPIGELPPLMTIAKSHMEARKKSESLKMIFLKSPKALTASVKELNDLVYKGSFDPEGFFKLIDYCQRLRRRTQIRNIVDLREADNILSKVNVRKMNLKEVKESTSPTGDKVEKKPEPLHRINDPVTNKNLEYQLAYWNCISREISPGIVISAAVLFFGVLYCAIPL